MMSKGGRQSRNRRGCQESKTFSFRKQKPRWTPVCTCHIPAAESPSKCRANFTPLEMWEKNKLQMKEVFALALKQLQQLFLGWRLSTLSDIPCSSSSSPRTCGPHPKSERLLGSVVPESCFLFVCLFFFQTSCIYLSFSTGS